MIELIEIFIIAIAQGISEFLPISSSGHNAVLNHLFERFGEPLTESSAEFVKLNILLHAGSLVAVLIVFRQRIVDMLGKDRRLIPMLIVATLPAVAVGLPIHKFAPWLEDYLPLISGCFMLTGILLLCTLRLPEGEKTTSTMTWTDALIIGCSQALAVLPGLSRSGTTIVTGLFCKLKREEAAAFSFLLSIPVIAGAGLLECYSVFKKGMPGPSVSAIPDWLLLTGAAVSCIVGIIALVFLLNWLKKGKLWYFAVWVFVMSPITMALAILPMRVHEVHYRTTNQTNFGDTFYVLIVDTLRWLQIYSI
jgi:undecaprenyl-diphosphatase